VNRQDAKIARELEREFFSAASSASSIPMKTLALLASWRLISLKPSFIFGRARGAIDFPY